MWAELVHCTGCAARWLAQKPCSEPKSCDPSVLWRSAAVQMRPPGAVPGRHAETVRGVLPDGPQGNLRSVRACAVAFERGHRPASEASLRPKCGLYLTRSLCDHHRGSGKHPRQRMPRDEDVLSRATSETTSSCASYQNCLRRIRRSGTRARLPCNTGWPAGGEHTPFRDYIFFRKDIVHSVIAAVTPDGDSTWMAAEELEPL